MQQQKHFHPRTRDSLAKWYLREADTIETFSKLSEKHIAHVTTTEKHLLNFQQQTN
jgi:hypothetical protein